MSDPEPWGSGDDWSAYLGGPGSSQYSRLDQIDRDNVSRLEVAWIYRSGDADPNDRSQIQVNPLVIGGVLYGTTPRLQLFALDAATGKEVWRKNLVQDYGAKIPPWYNGQCPLLHDGKLIIAPVGSEALMLALDPATGNEIRRIYLDGRQPPEYSDWYPMGFSSGRWEGSTLVVETTLLQPSIREWMGDPVSENARVVERYRMDDDGTLELDDPVLIEDRDRYRLTEDGKHGARCHAHHRQERHDADGSTRHPVSFSRSVSRWHVTNRAGYHERYATSSRCKMVLVLG